MMKLQGMRILSILFLVMIFVSARKAESQIQSFLINCGSNSSVKVDGRRWSGDKVSGNNFTIIAPGIEASSSMFNGDPLYEPLYRTARIFTNRMNYSYQGTVGNYFFRLHFYPLIFENYNANDSYFAVEVNGLKLLFEFNVPGEILHKNSNFPGSRVNSSLPYLVKENFLSVEASETIVNFVPSKGSFGFVNAIEMIPEDNKMFNDSARRVGVNDLNFLNLKKRGIETMYRLNVGGSSIKPAQDSFFWRMWETDSGYMINSDVGSEIHSKSNITYATLNDTTVAPLLVYETARTLMNTEVLEKRFNMSWKLEVDPDFHYLVHLHFCELLYDKPNQRIFRIYIDNKTAAENFDIFVRAGGTNKAYHEDYLDSISSKTKTLWIQLGPDTSTGSAGTDALLSGLEVFKLSRNGNLAYVQKYSDPEVKKSSRKLILWVGIGVSIASIAILAAVCMLTSCFCKKKREENGTRKASPGWRPLFLHESILNSTDNAKGSRTCQSPNGQCGSVKLCPGFRHT